jgi:hypothetical protein
LKVSIPIAIGELFDRLSILIIKKEMIEDREKLQLVEKEYELLKEILLSQKLEGSEELLKEMTDVNKILWKIEDDIREKERAKSFDAEFIELARQVYITNDKRFDVKNKINNKYGSEIREVKSYEEY